MDLRGECQELRAGGTDVRNGASAPIGMRARRGMSREMAPLDPGNDAENSRFAVGRMEYPGEDLDRGRLPCAVRPDVRDALASLDSERQLVDGFDPSPTPSPARLVDLRKLFDLDRHRRKRAPRPIRMPSTKRPIGVTSIYAR